MINWLMQRYIKKVKKTKKRQALFTMLSAKKYTIMTKQAAYCMIFLR